MYPHTAGRGFAQQIFSINNPDCHAACVRVTYLINLHLFCKRCLGSDRTVGGAYIISVEIRSMSNNNNNNGTVSTRSFSGKSVYNYRHDAGGTGGEGYGIEWRLMMIICIIGDQKTKAGGSTKGTEARRGRHDCRDPVMTRRLHK